MPKGYYTNYSYMGYVQWLDQYLPFATRDEYIDYISSSKGENYEH